MTLHARESNYRSSIVESRRTYPQTSANHRPAELVHNRIKPKSETHTL